ncbi:MAG: HEAT repeat domain-containing protein [Leptolyngbya sp. SIO4C1]|nr:HEAT repeat domain-containing protein [Leptolyngbya sp. SIO4C1]
MTYADFSHQGVTAPHSPDGQPLTLEQALTNIRQTQDSGLRYYAAWWLGRMRVSQSEAIEGLLDALNDRADRSPDGGFPLRRNAARALGKLGDRRAVPALAACLHCEDYYVREAAAQALEMLGDSACVPALLALLAGGVEAAVPVAGKPHLVQPYNAVIEALGTLGDAVLIPVIEPFLHHNTPQVRNAAARALYQLTGEDCYAERLVTVLQGDELQLRRAALMDLGAIGYTPAAHAIANTLAENSMKLMSLQGVLEAQIMAEGDSRTLQLSDTTQVILQLMDDLL